MNGLLNTEEFTRSDAETATELLTFDPVAWKQLGILVLDGSPSMTEGFADADDPNGNFSRTKAAAVDAAVKQFLAMLAVSSKRANFSIATVSFNDRVTHERKPTRIGDINHVNESFDPTAHGAGGGTAIFAGMETAYEIAQKWLVESSGSVPTSVVIAVLTDGECGDPTRTIQLAQRIKSEEPRIGIAAGMFATKGRGTPGTQLLQAIVTKPELYAVVYSAAQLRDWFNASITATVNSAQSAGSSNG